jgi:glycine/serine hydroxymethyltransferase
MSFLERSDPTVADIIRREEERQRFGLELIAVVAIAALTLLGAAITGQLSGLTGALGGGGSA